MAEDVFGIVGTTQADAYEVEDVVGEGGFAVVYRAHHTGFRAAVALKCLKVPDGLGATQQNDFLERFREEGELMFRLSSVVPSVVRPLHVGVADTPTGKFVPFIAMEWLDGETLDALLERRRKSAEGPLSLKEALRLLAPVADALSKAHHFPGPSGEMCILHRDLKPENIFVAKLHGQTVCKILDFGIGKVKSAATQIAGRQSAGADGFVAFTPAYGAPEQWLPKRFGQTGAWTDVWGLALTLVEALTGKTPLEGDQAAVLGSAIDPERRPTPRNEGAAVSDRVEAVFAKALAVDPRERYHDVGEFWRDLSRAAGLDEAGMSMPPPAHDPRLDGNVKPGGRVPLSEPPHPLARTRPVAELPSPGVDRGAATVVSPVSGIPDLDAGPSRRPRPAPGASAARPPERITVDRARGGAGIELGLDGVGITPGVAAPIRPRIASTAYVERQSSSAQIRERLRGPVRWVLFGTLLMAADFAYAATTGELFQIAGVRPLWVAGPIVVLGILSAVWRLVRG